MEKTVMKCGHTTTVADKNGKPYCLICDCREVAEVIPNLKGRKAVCCQCGEVVDSSLELPFFVYKPDKDKDSFYCGCGGWD